MNYKEKVVALLNSQELSKEQKEKLEDIFPELVESEDEKIRKALINQFSDYKRRGENHGFGYSNDKILAWLEKQGSKTAWSEEDKEKLNRIYMLLPQCVDCHPRIIGDRECVELQDWIKSLISQNRWKWSEEDVYALNTLSAMVANNRLLAKEEIFKLLDWLKFLKDRVQPQPKQEWSDEDEKKLLCICAWIKDYPRIADFKDEMYTVANNYIDWLKSIRPRNRWKPSDEQIELLQAIVNNPNNASLEGCQMALKDIIKQLKKLREE